MTKLKRTLGLVVSIGVFVGAVGCEGHFLETPQQREQEEEARKRECLVVYLAAVAVGEKDGPVASSLDGQIDLGFLATMNCLDGQRAR